MKLNNETRFPYPVLNSQTGDYKQGNFSLTLRIEEAPVSGKLKINYEVYLNEAALLNEVEGKAAIMVMFVTCLDTFYNQITVLDGMKGSVEFPAGTLKGRTTVKPLVCATQKISGYSNNNLHEEYGNEAWEFQNGSLLAIGNELVINVGHEKLAPMESIFTLAVNDNVGEGEIKVQIDSDNITIHSSTTTYQTINSLRGTKVGQSLLLNSIYLPVVMEVLSHLRDDELSFADKKWFKVFNSKCEHLGISYSNGNLLEDAQKLLKFPIGKLKSVGDQL
jgi:hypothetical protein